AAWRCGCRTRPLCRLIERRDARLRRLRQADPAALLAQIAAGDRGTGKPSALPVINYRGGRIAKPLCRFAEIIEREVVLIADAGKQSDEIAPLRGGGEALRLGLGGAPIRQAWLAA